VGSPNGQLQIKRGHTQFNLKRQEANAKNQLITYGGKWVVWSVLIALLRRRFGLSSPDLRKLTEYFQRWKFIRTDVSFIRKTKYFPPIPKSHLKKQQASFSVPTEGIFNDFDPS
jgi:hypothetical protein